jgi:hypothetical protein
MRLDRRSAVGEITTRKKENDVKYQIDQVTIVDTNKALTHWDEATDWNGNNHISRNTGSQWNHQTLYLSRKGNYYLVHESQWQGSLPSAVWLDQRRAAVWLSKNGHELPDDLAALADDFEE